MTDELIAVPAIKGVSVMFDPNQSAKLRDEEPEEPLLANLCKVSLAQRSALVSLLGGTAIRNARTGGKWIVPALGISWAIEHRTIRALADDELVVLGANGVRLTKRGIWYARTAAYREADILSEMEG